MTENASPSVPSPAGPRPMRRLMRILRSLLVGFVLFCTIGWATLAINYSNLPSALRLPAAGVFVLGSLACLFLIKRRWLGRICALGLFASVLLWWLLIPPSNNRDWQADVTILPYADIDGDRVAIHNIRNCDYRSKAEFDVRHYDRTFDLGKIRSADLYLVYWGSPAICHTMMSFGFEGDQYVCFSIETRKEKGEDYSTIKGFFRQYELTYVVADERDVVRLRTNYRKEQVYLYRLNTEKDVIRKVFLDYLRTANSLKAQPEWYNALTSNCTTNIRGHTVPYARKGGLDWRLIINGYVGEMAYERGALDRSLPFEQLKARSLVNERAVAGDKDERFSALIRQGLPGMAQ